MDRPQANQRVSEALKTGQPNAAPTFKAIFNDLRLTPSLEAVLETFWQRVTQDPGHVSSLLGRDVQRNRRFNSKKRRFLTEAVFAFLRHRTRVQAMVDEGKAWQQILTELDDASSWLKSLGDVDPSNLARWVSFPQWWVDRWIQTYGLEKTTKILLALNQPAPVTIRANTLKTDRDALIDTLAEQGTLAHKGKLSPWAIHLEGRSNLRGTDAFRDGLFEFQDEGSQALAMAMEVEPGMRILDVGARSGGKSLALAAAMENHGSILAVDADARFEKPLKARAKRAGVSILSTKWVGADDPKPLPKEETFDRIFIDAPCSSSGVVRRHPEIKWTLTPEHINELTEKQRGLVERYATYLKPDGDMLFAVCSLFQEEGPGCVKTLLEEPGHVTLKASARLTPDDGPWDGYFWARLKT